MFVYFRTNLDVTKDQVTDQHAYVQQLRSTEADPNLVEQEKLVEKQLRKRQVCLYKGQRNVKMFNYIILC